MNKKILAGIGVVSIFGATVVGALIGGHFVRQNAIKNRLKAIEDAKKSDANLLESEKYSQKSGVLFNAPMSLVSPQHAKISFTIPAKYTGQSLSLFYKPVTSVKQPLSVTLTTTKTTTNQNISFLLNVSAQTTYEYQLTTSAASTDPLFYSRLKTPKMPLLEVTGGFRSANVKISNLEDYKATTLVLKAVEKSVYEILGKNAFETTFLSQEILINSKEDKKNVWFKPIGNRSIKDETTYVLMLFDEKGLVPILNESSEFTTSLNKVEINSIQPGVGVATFTLAQLKPYQGKDLIIAYKKVSSADSFFRPIDSSIVEFKVAIPVFREGDEAAIAITIPNLTPDSIYKLQIFDSLDAKKNDEFLVNPITIVTKKRPTIQTNLDGKANPDPEVHAAYLKLTNFTDYMDKTLGTLNGLKVKYQKKTSGALANWSTVTTEVEIKEVTAGEIYAGISILGLDQSSVYVYQLFAGTSDEPLLESNQEFLTKAGFTSAGVKPVVSLGKNGQTSAQITFTGEELAQFFVENSSNTLELRYTKEPAAVVTAEIPEVDWNKESTDAATDRIFKTTTKITKNSTGGYTATTFELSSLEKATKYLFAIFVGPNQIADVMVEKSSFFTREEVIATTIPLATKAIVSTNALKSYVGQDYQISYYPKPTSGTTPATTDIKTLPIAKVPEDGKIEATLGSSEEKLTVSTEYEYKIEIVESATVRHEVAKPTFTTKATEFSTPKVTAKNTYPTSVVVEFENLEGLKNQELQLIYRKLGETSYSIYEMSFTPTTETTTHELKGLTHLTQYEINFILKATPSQVISSEWVSVTTKDVIELVGQNVTQTSFGVKYSKYETYGGESLTLKYWKSMATDETKETVPTDTTKIASSTISVIKDGDNTPTVADSILQSLDPQSKYSFQLFKGDFAISYIKNVTTLNQVKVEKVESFISSANVILTNIQTIEGGSDEKLKLILVEVIDGTTTEPTSYSSSKYVTEFTKGSQEKQNFLIEGLTKEKTYILQVFKVSDRSYANPLITTKLTNSDDKRSFKLLTAANTPVVTTKLISNSSAKLLISKLDAFVGQKLVLKYKPSYWSTKKEYKFDVPSKKINETDTDITVEVILTDLLVEDPSANETQDWFYEIYVEINGDNSKIQLLDKTGPEDVKTTFKTNHYAKVTKESIYSTRARIQFNNLLDYKSNVENSPLVLKAVVQKPNTPVDWSSTEGIVLSEIQKDYSSIADNIKMMDFDLTTLLPNTEYVYQLFVDGLNQPILKQEGSFKTKEQISLKLDYATNLAAKLLMSNATSYIGQKIQVSFKTDASTTKTIEIVISDASFTKEMQIPILLEGITTIGQEIQVNLKGVEEGGYSPELLPSPLTFKMGETAKVGLIMTQSTTEQPEVVLGGNDAAHSIAALNYLKGKTLVFSYKDESDTSGKWSTIEFTIPKNYTENTFAIPTRLSGIVTSGTKSYSIKLTDKDSEFANEVNFLGTTAITFMENDSVLSTLSPKTGSTTGKPVAEIELSAVDTVEKWKTNFAEQTLTGYTVAIVSVNPNMSDNTAILTLSFTKDSVTVNKSFTIRGFKAPTATPAPVALPTP